MSDVAPMARNGNISPIFCENTSILYFCSLWAGERKEYFANLGRIRCDPLKTSFETKYHNTAGGEGNSMLHPEFYFDRDGKIHQSFLLY